MKKNITVWLRDHNDGKNYDVIETEIIELGVKFRVYFCCQNKFAETEFCCFSM